MIELSHICVNALRLQNKYHSVDFYKVIALPENPLVLNLINFEVIQIERRNMIVRNLLKERTLRWIVEECIIIGDILDKNLVEQYFKDADVVHHLAGVTNVPRTKSESSEFQDKKIKEVGEIGTQNILDVINDKCKIILSLATFS